MATAGAEARRFSNDRALNRPVIPPPACLSSFTGGAASNVGSGVNVETAVGSASYCWPGFHPSEKY